MCSCLKWAGSGAGEGRGWANVRGQMDTGPGQWTRHGSRTSGRGKWKVDLGHHQAVRVRLPRHIAQAALDINIHDSGAVLVLLMWRWRQFLPAWIQILRRQGNSQLSLMRIMRSPEEMARGRGHGAAQHCAAPITISIISWCIASLYNNRISTNKHKDNKNVRNVIFSPPPYWIMLDNSTVGMTALKRMSNCSQCGFFNQFCGLMIVMDKQGTAVTIISLLLTNH